jgi:hypothetical protein
VTRWVLVVGDVILAALVWFDAKRLRIPFNGVRTGGTPLSPIAWAAGALLVPIMFVPAYVLRRCYLYTIDRPRNGKSG